MGRSYVGRFPVLRQDAQYFWSNLFEYNIRQIRNADHRLLLRAFFTSLDLSPIEMEPGLMARAVRFHLKHWHGSEREALLITLKNWASMDSCLRPSSEPARERAHVSERSPKGRIAAG